MYITVKTNTSVFIPEEYRTDLEREINSYGYKLEEGVWNIPNGIIGTISTEKLTLEIKPSIDYLTFYDYFNLLKLNLNSKLRENSIFSVEGEYNSLAESILAEFRNELIKLSKNGIPRKYKTQEVRSNFFYGNTDIVNTWININTCSNPPVVSSTEKLSLDYPELIEINKAYRKYIRLTGSKILEFERVSKFIPHSLSSIGYLSNIYFKKLEYCYDLAYMIINNLDGFKQGNKSNLSHLINSNDVFEKFIINFIKDLFPDHPFKEKENLDVAQTEDLTSTLSIEPDLMYMGPLKVVLDMKNKNYFKGLNSSDYHQMISYMSSFSSSSSILIYPVVADTDIQILNVIESNKRIIRYPINIKTLNHKLVKNDISRYISFE
ncbi:McrC family protein [Acinetobacter baumannii]|uniref:McrC family protein n=1 Tax=Acinetobacter baumannii TaxID=470 RepID=UPI001FF12C3D|nr:McrC family protein [Acinetobacter baumannii]MCJ9204338.1 McrC family protein [Acinetobacter baumannii]MCJ9234111.1 McrC family protein [Acinetobacter baumannii]MCJ9274405.1 McrC family protein [Acinetobacter baumannii]MCJ9328363.1 McrC family protein [Acinetobacter baumannii]MCJ9525722.1 McrC family protein [Acinetobacter baumannii]